jgi:hypothetical protein
MPQRLQWSESADAYLIQLRAEGATWDAIARALRLSRWAVIGRGGALRARRTPPRLAPPAPRDLLDPAREPLPAGHPTSWGLITAGTLLEGSPYAAPGDAVRSDGED